MKKFTTANLLVLISMMLLATPVVADYLPIGKFSSWTEGTEFQDDWEEVFFSNVERPTQYEVTQDSGQIVVRASSNNSASMLAKKINIDPKQYPVLQWRWKIENTIEAGDVYHKDSDDYAARIYITFDYDRSNLGWVERIKVEAFNLFYGEYPPLRAINYIWDHKNPKDLVVANPYTSNVKMIVIESGPQKRNQWLSESRNILEDYESAFGESAPNISGIAIMTDTDNTGASVTAWYGDLSFKKSFKKLLNQ